MLCYQNIVFKMVALLGSDPWTSGKRLILWRFWVLIPAPYTGWTVFSLFGCKNVIHFCLTKNENKQKRVRGWPVTSTIFNFVCLPKVLSKILLYMTALDFLWTIRWVMAWYFFRNSLSLWVDSSESERVSLPDCEAEKSIRWSILKSTLRS